MGKQYNKTEKRRRRAAYIERNKTKTKAGGYKPKVKKPVKKKAAPAA